MKELTVTWTGKKISLTHESGVQLPRSSKVVPQTPSPPSSFPFSPTPHAFFWFPSSCLSWDLCTLSSSARNPSPTHHDMLLPSHCHLSFNDVFSESSCTVHWPVALNFPHPCIFIISFLGHFKCIIVDHPPRL